MEITVTGYFMPFVKRFHLIRQNVVLISAQRAKSACVQMECPLQMIAVEQIDQPAVTLRAVIIAECQRSLLPFRKQKSIFLHTADLFLFFTLPHLPRWQ